MARGTWVLVRTFLALPFRHGSRALYHPRRTGGHAMNPNTDPDPYIDFDPPEADERRQVPVRVRWEKNRRRHHETRQR